MKPTHTKLDSFEFGTELLSWEKLYELQSIPGVDHIRSYTSAVDHRTKIVEVEGTASGLRAVRANLGIPQKPKKPAKTAPSDQDKAIKDCHELLGMIQAELRHPVKNKGLDLLRSENLRCRLADVVVHLAQLNGEDGTMGEMRDNLVYFLDNRKRYHPMSLRWVCSLNFWRY